ncbi:MAG: aspartate carbamoyltransferase catalytic subunit, partial [Candidatus Binatia bacterium]|nr:aspartate carbamoyltransferase catalytic subunit [Candidatus Binatia bacterium]
MSKRDLITIGDLSDQEIEEIFSLADAVGATDRLGSDRGAWSGRIMATLFYEPSTRTRLSFESAMQRLGGSVLSCPDMKSSSTAKGEIISDTARVVSSYSDLLVVRHYWDGAVRAMAERAEVPVINAGDGSHEHPTQTLCDLYTLKKEKGKLKDLTVVICGDLKLGRTIHSLVYALARFGVHVVILAARGMELPQYVIERLDSQYHYGLAPVPSDNLHAVVTETDAVYLTPNEPHQLALFTEKDLSLQSRLGKMVSGMRFDAFYVTRQQKERQVGSADQLKGEYPRIGEEFLKERQFKDTVVMHPLPRVDELSQAVDADPRGIYFKQAAYGVPVRMALLQFLFGARERAKPRAARSAVPLYESPVRVDSQCPNTNCVTRAEAESSRPRYEIQFAGPGSTLLARCIYCDHQLKVKCTGHLRSKRYCSYDPSLEETVKDWLGSKELMIFDSLKQAEELGFEPYKTGPQRILMREDEMREAIHRIA